MSSQAEYFCLSKSARQVSDFRKENPLYYIGNALCQRHKSCKETPFRTNGVNAIMYTN